MKPNRTKRISTLLASTLVASAGVVTLLPAESVGAATVATTNVCSYPFYDVGGYAYRDTPSSISGEASAPSATVGQSVTLTGATFSGEIGGSLIAYGYNSVGLFPTQLPNTTVTHTVTDIDAWVAVTGSNTTEGTQVVHVPGATATTTVTDVNGTGTATPLTFTMTLPPTTWTATGGDITLRQAVGDAIGALEAPAGGPRSGFDPKGSVYVRTVLDGLFLNMDCQPGVKDNESGSSFTPGTPAPFSTVTVGGGGPVDPEPEPDPETAFDCISNLGAYDDQEIVPMDFGVVVTNTPLVANGQVSLRNVRFQGTIPGELIAAGYARNQFPLGETVQTAQAYVAVEGSNTVEAVQMLSANFTWTSSVQDPTPGDKDSGDEVVPDVSFDAALPTTLWSPDGAGDVAFHVAPEGSLPRLTIISNGYAGIYPTWPYGSIFVRSTTGHYGSNFDCVAGDVVVNTTEGTPTRTLYGNIPPETVPDPLVPDQTVRGSQGRYTITPAATPLIAEANVVGDGATAATVISRQVATVEVVGAPLKISQVANYLRLSNVAPGGVATGSLSNVTVTDQRGTNAGWNLTGQFSAFESATSSIPASNVGWTPTASIAHEPFVGDVAQVVAGPLVDGLTAGLDVAQTLCSSPTGVSGGTFACDAALVLNVPATATNGSYSGTLTSTLILTP